MDPVFRDCTDADECFVDGDRGTPASRGVVERNLAQNGLLKGLAGERFTLFEGQQTRRIPSDLPAQAFGIVSGLQ